MYNSKFFKDDEFERVGCTRSQINDSSLERLDRAREIAGIPFVITSAYRSPESEVEKGRSGHSAHTVGCAFDIKCLTNEARWHIVFGALAAGFKRIGIGSTFVHMDDLNDLTGHPAPRIWLY